MLPELFLKRMQETLGDEYEEFVESLGQDRFQAFRLNVLKVNKNGYRATDLCGRDGFMGSSPVSWADNGYYFEKNVQPGKHPYHEAGVYYIQEPSAMAPVPMLMVKPGDKVLDLCAAPGGKSTQIGAALNGEGLLVCNEINPQRAKILSENIERMGVWNACVTNEAPERLSKFFPDYFDKVLVDAPCSGEGMFRKNEDACGEWSPENVKMCAERQDYILDEAAKMLRCGGRLVYSTCTFAETEDEGSVNRFVKRHPEFTLLEMKRLWPHKDKGEGHFAAVLAKEGNNDADNLSYDSVPANGYAGGVSVKDLGEFAGFAEEFLAKNIGGGISKIIHKGLEGDTSVKYTKFGDNIYLVPAIMPSVKGIRCLRMGLHIGELKKNRFEPAHALALALNPSEVRFIKDLDSEERTVKQYLNGQTFPADGEKGWYLICVDGFSIGWGKLAGGMMKNHYPKGLRINL